MTFAKRQGARLHVVHVLEWSPYTFLTPDELAHRHQQREQDFARATEKVLVPILEKIRAGGIEVGGDVRFGNVPDVVSDVAGETKASLIFVGRSNTLSARLLGSVASGLAQTATVPVVIVP
jgi:nucleotide-binding universal stress UspA family protein